MTLTECKEFMRLYQRGAEGEQYNWRTTARWALRHRWAQEENERLRDELRHATERAERACIWAWSEFEQAWEAQCDGWLFTEYYEGDWSHCPRCGHRVRLQEKVQP